MKTAIVNIGQIISGDWRYPITPGSSILLEGEHIYKVGEVTGSDIDNSDVMIDAGGSIAVPGLIDSHVHITFGDYTPRQNPVGSLHR